MSNGSRHGVTTCDIVQAEIKSLHDTYGSWQRVKDAKHPKIPRGTLSRIAKEGYVPKKWYAYFNIQEYKPAPVCLRCGNVHVTKRCTLRRRYRSLFDMPVKILREAIERREEV